MSFCEENGIALQAHTVLAQARFMSYPPLVAMARRKQATPAQVLLRFALDNGVDAVVSSTRQDHLAELVEAAAGSNWHLDSVDLAEMFMWSTGTAGATHRFYNRLGRVPPVVAVSSSTDVDQYVAQVADMLSADLRIVDEAKGSATVALASLSDMVLSLPTAVSARAIRQDPISLQIAMRMFSESRDPLRCYIQCVKKLQDASSAKERMSKADGAGRSCLLRGGTSHPQSSDGVNEGRIPADDGMSINVLEPAAMPVTVAPRDELAPFLQFIESKESVPLSSHGVNFVRGTLFADGRME
jgi:hypothetical protein